MLREPPGVNFQVSLSKTGLIKAGPVNRSLAETSLFKALPVCHD